MADEWEDLKTREERLESALISHGPSTEREAMLKHKRGRVAKAQQAIVDRAIELSLVCFVCGHHVRNMEHDFNCAVGKR